METRFHNLQSFYDTYVLGSDLTQQDQNIPALRGLISLIYHLLIVLTQAIHYYQRHYLAFNTEHKIRFLRQNKHTIVTYQLLSILVLFMPIATVKLGVNYVIRCCVNMRKMGVLKFLFQAIVDSMCVRQRLSQKSSSTTAAR